MGRIVMKFLKNFSLILIFIFVVLVLFLISLTFNNQDTCLDTGFCSEGLELNTQNGKILINEKTCAENNGTWITNKKVCKFKIN